MALQERFTRPDGWRTGEFANPLTGHHIHYGHAAPNGVSRGTVVILPGLSEFTEKYYELMRDMLARGLAVYVIDWAYQGRSSRMASAPMRRHSDGFDTDITDLHHLMRQIVIPDSPNSPFVMIGHSMGGHIGLRYLAAHPGIFAAAAFSAPMLGINDLKHTPPFLLAMLFMLLRPFNTRYIPRGRDWHETMRKSNGEDIFSSDPVRDTLHNHWCGKHPELRVGNVTIKWVYEALTSIKRLMPVLRQIAIPVYIAAARQDSIVDNDAIIRAAAIMPGAALDMLDGARHEILMERDDIRARWLAGFDKLLQRADI